MLHVGLTGNIASGKSVATQAFVELGAQIIDADIIAHGLLNPGTDTYGKVVDGFGPEILNSDGSVNRRALGRIIFPDAEKRAILNGILHPEVRKEILRRIYELEKTSAAGIIIIDAALMVESGSYRMYDRLIVVYCDPQLQLARIVSRDGLSIEEASSRMAAQMPVEEKLKLAHFNINTSGTFRETRMQIDRIYRELVLLELEMRDDSEL